MSAIAKTQAQKNITYYVIVALCLILMFFGGYIIPPFAPEVTQLGMQILCIFVGMVILWSTVGGVIWPSIAGVIALGLTPYTTVGEAITTAISQSTLWQVMMCLALATAIAQSGAGEVVVRWALSRKVMRGRPLLFSFCYLFVLRMISAVSNPLGMILLGWAILESVAHILKRDLGEKWFRAMSVFTIASCCCGDLIIPFKTWLTALWNAFGELMGGDLNFMVWFFIVFIFGTLAELFIVGFLKVAKIDVSFLRDIDPELLKQGSTRMNLRQGAALGTMLVAILLGLSQYIFPAGVIFNTISKTLTMAGVFSVAVVCLVLLKDKEGKPLMDFKKAMAPGAYWGSFFIIASAIPISSALLTEEAGFSAWLTNVLGPMFENSSTFQIYLLVMVVVTLLTNVASNAGIGMMFLPIVIPIALASGTNPFVAGICCIMSANFGLITPGASSAAALVFGNKEELKLKTTDIMGFGTVFLLFYFVCGAIGFPILDAVIPY